MDKKRIEEIRDNLEDETPLPEEIEELLDALEAAQAENERLRRALAMSGMVEVFVNGIIV